MPDKNSPQERANEPWTRLSTLPLTNWKGVSGTLLIWCVVAFLCILVWNVRARDSVLMAMVDSLLMFTGVVAGVIPAAMFAAKRATFKVGGPDDKRSDVVTSASAKHEGVPSSPPASTTSQPDAAGGKGRTPDPDKDG